MKIAVTYENGQVFQHFGRCENFKIYNVEDGKVIGSAVIGSNGSGHGALAGLMAQNMVDVLICGGIGAGAINALAASGIMVCAGQQGNTDELVEAYLRGELEDQGTTCNCHHDHGEDHECHCGDEGHDHGEEGCGCGCGHHRPSMEGKNVGKNVSVHYRGTLNDGTQFDSSYDRGQTLDFVCGAGMMIRGFDLAVANMEVGEVVDVHLMPEEAYGMPDPRNIFVVNMAEMPGTETLNIGQRVLLADNYGQRFPVTVTEKTETTITFDANHEMAGKELNFRIELVAVH